MKIELESKLEQINFSLKQKHSELEKVKVDIFTLNPQIQKLVKEIDELELEKKELEEHLNNEE